MDVSIFLEVRGFFLNSGCPFEKFFYPGNVGALAVKTVNNGLELLITSCVEQLQSFEKLRR